MPRATATRRITDDFGTLALYRRCSGCQSWKTQRIGNFSPRKRDAQTRRVVRWDSLCLECRKAYRREQWAKKSPEQRAAISQRRWEKVKQDPDLLEQRRRQNRERQAEARARDPEAAREAVRRNYWSRRLDSQRWQEHLESARLAYRLRQEREGRDLSTMRRSPSRLPEPDGGRVPVGPLIEAVEDWMARNQRDTEEMCAMVGIDSKSWRRWKSGESQNTDLRVADAILTVIGQGWWQVWPEDEQARLVFEGPARSRVRVSDDPLGDYKAKRKATREARKARRAERQAA